MTSASHIDHYKAGPSGATPHRKRSRLKKILVIDRDGERAARLADCLGRSGFEVSTAEGCLHALTMLEWHRPDLIAVHPEADDMPPEEFCHTVRQDPLFNRVPTALIAPSDQHEAARNFDLVLEGDSEDMVATRVRELLWRGFGKPSAEKRQAAGRDRGQPRSLLLTKISRLEKEVRTGLLHMERQRQPEPCFLLFDNGQVVHAEIGRTHGPMALERILVEAERPLPTRYRFEEMERWKITAYPRSIRREERQRAIRTVHEEDSDPRATREIHLNDL